MWAPRWNSTWDWVKLRGDVIHYQSRWQNSVNCGKWVCGERKIAREILTTLRLRLHTPWMICGGHFRDTSPLIHAARSRSSVYMRNIKNRLQLKTSPCMLATLLSTLSRRMFGSEANSHNLMHFNSTLKRTDTSPYLKYSVIKRTLPDFNVV